MSKKRNWSEIFYNEVQNLAQGIVQEAYDNSQTYGDATLYVRKIRQSAFGDVPDMFAKASMRTLEITCELALSMIHEDERNLPIKHEEE